MALEPISSVVDVTPASAVAEYARHAHRSPAQVAVDAGQARLGESDEQLADAGDPLAAARVAAVEDGVTPVRAQGLLPADPAAHAPGKGDRIDVYD